MENLQHIKSRIEREIEEVMGEKKWTPRHAEVIEELLSCEKCIKEIEKMAHAKKRMMGLPAPTEEEDEEMMQEPWSFGMYARNDYARGGNGGGGRSNYTRRGPNGYRPYNYNMNRYEDDEDEFAMPNRRMLMNYNYEGNDYHHDPEYLIWLKKKKHHKKDWDDDDDDDDEDEKLKKRMKKLWKQMQQEEHGFSSQNGYAANSSGMSSQNSDGNQGSNQTVGRTPTGTTGK